MKYHHETAIDRLRAEGERLGLRGYEITAMRAIRWHSGVTLQEALAELGAMQWESAARLVVEEIVARSMMQ